MMEIYANWTGLEAIFADIDANVISGGATFVTGLLILAILIHVAMKGRVTLPTAIALFVPVVAVMSTYGFLPPWIGMVVILAVGALLGIAISGTVRG